MILRYAILIAMIGGAVHAETTPMMTCARPEVLNRVAQVLRAQGSAAAIVPGVVGERPGPVPHTLTCDIVLERVVFDTGRRGTVPEVRQQYYAFTVRQARNGLFVDMAPAPTWLEGVGGSH